MGSVWRARDLRDRTRASVVAAKVLGAHDSSILLRFVREQSVRIRHPHVVAPTGWAAEDHRVVFTMDLVRGGSLETLLAEHGPLPESYVAVLLDQLLAGARRGARRRRRAPRRQAGQPAARAQHRSARTCGSATSGWPCRSTTSA